MMMIPTPRLLGFQGGLLAMASILLASGTRVAAATVLALDGINDRAAGSTTIFPNSGTLRSFTAEAWFFPRSAGHMIATDDAYDIILFRQTGSANGGVGIRFALYNSAGTSYSLTEFRGVTLNQWNHVAVMFDATTQNRSIAINGILDSPSFLSGMTAFLTDPSYNLSVGGDNSGGGSLNGYIDEFRVSDVVRYRTDFTPSHNFDLDPNTVALFHFSEAPGSTTFGDSSPNAYSLSGLNGAVVGTTTRPGGDPPPPGGGPSGGPWIAANTATLLDMTAQGFGYLVVSPGDTMSVGENGADQAGDRGYLAFQLDNQARTDIAQAQSVALQLAPSSRIDLESTAVYVDVYGFADRVQTAPAGSDYLASCELLLTQAVTSHSPTTSLMLDVTRFVKTEAARSASSVVAFRLHMGPSVPYLDGLFNQFGFSGINSTNLASRPALLINVAPSLSTSGLGAQGQTLLRLAGPMGSTVILEASADLSTWAPAATNTIPAAGSVAIEHSLDIGNGRQFYRAKSP